MLQRRVCFPGQFACVWSALALVTVGCETASPPPGATFLDSGTDAATVPDADGTDSAITPDAEVPDAGSDAGSAYDTDLAAQISLHGLTGDPTTLSGLRQIRPSENALVRLGQVLFFSQSQAGSYDSSCGTCHDPDFGGSDGLSISVGVVPTNRMTVGPGRRVDPARDFDALADTGPNMHRNSLTMFNAALHDRALFMDGRVFVLDPALVSGGHGQSIRTPETGVGGDTSGASGLLEVMGRFPTVNDNEMRGFLYTNLTTPFMYRERLLSRMRGTADAQYMSPNTAQNWLALFRAGFDQPAGDADTLITQVNVQRALAAYIASQIFVDTPWKRYVEGARDAISDDAKQGALLFLKGADQGGFACSSCHAGDFFTRDTFANVGFPQIGRGFRFSDKHDMGRWLATRREEDMFAQRVPSLLNVALTAPYGHAGTFATLEEVVSYHVNPRAAVNTFDFTLQHLEQFRGTAITYPHAEPYTREVIAAATFTNAELGLPRRSLTPEELSQLVAFLNALTDTCANTPSCRSAWTPEASLDPDGHMLVRDKPNSPAPDVFAETPRDYPAFLDLTFQTVSTRTTFADTMACPNGMTTVTNADASRFVNRTGDMAFGLTAPHAFTYETWRNDDGMYQTEPGGMYFDAVMQAGGVTATYLDDDCWPDIVFTGGDASGLMFFSKRDGTPGYSVAGNLLATDLRTSLGTRFTGVGVADLDGDFRRELLFGNLHQGAVPILSMADGGNYYQAGALPMSRNTYGISFGLLGTSGYPDIYLAHWSNTGNQGTAPALFENLGGLRLAPNDGQANTSSASLEQVNNFTPKFADFTGDGLQDLVIASDFETSQTLQNADDVSYTNVTDPSVVTDENGMGSALGDFDNDGRLDWFVTSVSDPSGVAAANWGVTGNRLYRNVSTANALRFEDATEASGVRDGAWGWGACAADFNHDGWIDIFHVNGFGYIPDGILPSSEASLKVQYDDATKLYFQQIPSRLFINDGDGTFTNQATAWGIDLPSEGRGVICFDHDRDGDIDIALVDHSTGIQFFENQIGHGNGRAFLNLRIVGAPPNTDALGAVVTVVANVDATGAVESQVRISEANSNFNSQNLPDLHFGLGQASVIDSVTIRWPNDAVELVCNNVNINQFLVFDQRNKVCP